jgi:hypothetical protein
MGWELAWFAADGTPLETYHSIERTAIDARIATWLAANPDSRVYVHRLGLASHGGASVTVLEQIVTREHQPEY